MLLTPMDYVRAAIAQAMAERMTLADLWACAEHAETCEALDVAVEILAGMKPETPNAGMEPTSPPDASGIEENAD